MRIAETGVVFDFDMAQLAGAAEVAGDGCIVAVFSRYTDAIVGNVGLIYRSADSGGTWQDTGGRLTCESYGEGAIHVALGMARLPDDRLLLPYVDMASGRRSPADHPRHMKNRPRKSICRMLESTDHGRNWSSPRTLDLPARFNVWYPYGKIRALNDERIVLPLHASRIDEGGQVADSGMRYAISSDGGRNWPEMRSISSENAHLLSETDMLFLPDGAWLAVSRQPGPDMLTTCSVDGGRTWAPCRSTGIWGHSPSLLLMPGGRLYVAYRKISGRSGKIHVSKGGRAGLGISWSDDLGKTWRGELTLQDPKGYRYQYGHETGMPCMLALPDGRIMVVFYSYDPELPYAPEDETWEEVAHFYKRYIAMNILEER